MSSLTYVSAPIQIDNELKWQEFSLNVINFRSNGSSKICYECVLNKDNQKKPVALLKTCASLNRAARIAFEMETQTVLEGHPSIVQVFNSFCYLKNNEIRWMQIQYLYEGDLKVLIKNPPSIKDVQDIFVQLVKGLTYIHSKKVILGDMKPENILFHHDGKRILVVYSDWDGSSVNGNLPSHTRNYKYLSPELIPYVGPTCEGNIWSLGLIVSQFRPNSLAYKLPYEIVGDFKDNIPLDRLKYEITLFTENLSSSPFKEINQRMLNLLPNERPPLAEVESSLALIT
jgi:serine/threonine protein kinase